MYVVWLSQEIADVFLISIRLLTFAAEYVSCEVRIEFLYIIYNKKYFKAGGTYGNHSDKHFLN